MTTREPTPCETRELTPFEKCQADFANASSLSEATKIVWSRSPDISEVERRGMFQHYTTLNRVLEKIITRRWYLTRCDSKKLNDLKESEKYGRSRKQLMQRTYITCFGNGAGESVAMWGLYGRNDPFAMRISIPRKTVDEWLGKLSKGQDPEAKDSHGTVISLPKIQEVAFRDIIYVATQGKEYLDNFDIRRTDTIRWSGDILRLNKDCNLKHEIRKPEYAGWLKDYEWHHEQESRLCLQLKTAVKGDAISIAIPPEVIADMRFTFSPWLECKDIQRTIQDMVEVAMTSSGIKIVKRMQRFRRSVLQGALNFNL